MQKSWYKLVLQSVLFIALGFLFLFFLIKVNLLDINLIKLAVVNRLDLVLLACLSVLLSLVLTVWRFFLVVQSIGLSMSFINTFLATTVSFGLGQWLPGAMAFTEIIRASILIGFDAQTCDVPATQTRVAAACFWDRIIGLGCFLCFGLISSVVFMLMFKSYQGVFVLFMLFSGLGTLTLVSIPWLVRWRVFSQFLLLFKKIHHKYENASHTLLRLTASLCHLVFVYGENLRSHMALKNVLMGKIVSAIILGFFNVVNILWLTYVCALALGYKAAWLQIAIALPLVACMSLLPLGFGGMGGYQAIAVLVYGAVGLSSIHMGTASLLANALQLVVLTLLALLSFTSCFKKVRSQFHS